jgi:hypothetical protein
MNQTTPCLQSLAIGRKNAAPHFPPAFIRFSLVGALSASPAVLI